LKVGKVKIFLLFMVFSILSLFAGEINFNTYSLKYVNDKALVVVYNTERDYLQEKTKLSSIIKDVNFVKSSDRTFMVCYYLVNRDGSYKVLKDTRLDALRNELYSGEMLSIEDSSWGQIKDLFR